MNSRSRPSTAMFPYKKEDVIAGLKDARARIEEGILSYEKAMERWKVEAPARFLAYVQEFEVPKSAYDRRRHINMDSFAPPRQHDACDDYRIGTINKAIARIGMMAEDQDGVIKLRRDDEIFASVGLGECNPS